MSKWIDQKHQCVKCGEFKTRKEGLIQANEFICFTCYDKAVKERRDRQSAELQKLADNDYYEKQVMLTVIKELCPVIGWYSLKTIAQNFNVKVFGIDKPDNIHVSGVLNKLGFSKRVRKHHGYMHVFIDPNQLKGGDKA